MHSNSLANFLHLPFGNQAIYNPGSIIIKVGNDNNISVWKQEEIGTIMFNIEENYTTYYIVISDSLTDTLYFELAGRKSTSCCGNVTYSKKTLLNGLEIENKDLVVIIH